MKKIILVTFLCLSGLAVLAQFSLDKRVIAGGGGASTGGVYSVNGTIGQHDAGTMSGDRYSLVGGFWALPVAVQTPGAPTLHIAATTPGFARVWWSSDSPGFMLQVSPTVAPAAWSDAPGGTNNPAIVPATLPLRFYRLIRQ